MQNIALINGYFPELDKNKVLHLLQLQDLYAHWNSQINVVSRKDMDEFMLRHVIHSLAITQFIQFRNGTQIMDLGCGGGFPGIPLAIIFPEVEFLLVDSIGKKIKVVSEIAQALQLKNVTALQARAEDIKQQFDFVVSRAVAPLEQLLYWTYKKYKKLNSNAKTNGLICLKGGDLHQEISDAHNYLKASKIPQNITFKNISEWYTQEFFETKKLVYCAM
jgi:16S rRNA (guanine527-N7)-methyltransferase